MSSLGVFPPETIAGAAPPNLCLIPPLSSVGVLAAVPPTTVCSVPPTTVFGAGVAWSRPRKNAPIPIDSTSSEAMTAAAQIERFVRGVWSVPTLVLISVSLRSRAPTDRADRRARTAQRSVPGDTGSG